MSLPNPRNADFKIRLMRSGIAGFGRVSTWLRRPPKPPGEVREYRYGPDAAQRVDEITPRSGAPDRLPVLYIHGGGWIIGKKESYTRFLSFLADAGHPVYNVEYPLAPEHPHPLQLRGLLAALDWLAKERPDTRAYHVIGDSAGGNLAMMVGLLARNPRLVGAVDPDRDAELPMHCASVVSLYGVLDRLSWIEDGFPGGEVMMRSYGGEAVFESTVDSTLAITPMDLDFAEAPPALLAVGEEDPLLRSSKIFAERLAAGGHEHELKVYPGEGHGFLNFGRKVAAAESLNAEVLRFLSAVEAA
ncbi:MAG: alpha/beta hydrolase [Deltaproteobacteria bacterium]|jgi:acetyl esterase|nr:alpha/beta hydrolase [Deltaproteobacteria bacterium]